MYLLFIYGAARNDFDSGKTHFEGPSLPMAQEIDFPTSKKSVPGKTFFTVEYQKNENNNEKRIFVLSPN